MMRYRNRRIAPVVWMLLLLLHLTGCSTYGPAMIPDGAEAPAEDGQAQPIHVGSYVRVVYGGGHEISGPVVEISAEEIVVTPSGRLLRDARTIAIGDIESIEISRPTGFARAMSWTTGVIIVCAVTAGILLAAALDDGGPGS